MTTFRNLDTTSTDPVETWGVEGILERGRLTDWHKLATTWANATNSDLAAVRYWRFSPKSTPSTTPSCSTGRRRT